MHIDFFTKVVQGLKALQAGNPAGCHQCKYKATTPTPTTGCSSCSKDLYKHPNWSTFINKLPEAMMPTPVELLQFKYENKKAAAAKTTSDTANISHAALSRSTPVEFGGLGGTEGRQQKISPSQDSLLVENSNRRRSSRIRSA